MSNSKKVKPQFGREMDPCEYESKWANKLAKEDVIAIKVEDNKVKVTDMAREDGR